MNDLRIAIRNLLRSPQFAVLSILTLTLAIGANTAMFSIFQSVLLRPLPYRQPAGLYTVQESVPVLAQLHDKLPVSAHHFLEWRAHTKSFDSLSLVGMTAMTLTAAGEPRQLAIGRVSSSLFQQLGIVPELGRTFRDEEDRPGSDQVLVLSHELWLSQFGGDRSVIGRKVLLNGSPFEVVGVLPAQPTMPKLRELVSMPMETGEAQAWKPFAIEDRELAEMGDFNFGCIARLKPGITAAQALADLNGAEKAIAARIAEKVVFSAVLTPVQEQITGPAAAGLELLLGAGGAVMLIVCVNLASLLLIRVNGRRRELAIRAAMGAGTGRLIRQLVTESLLLAVIAGSFGVLVANWILELVVRNAPQNLPRLHEIQIDGSVLAFAVVLSLATGLACGLLPGWRFARVNASEALKANSRTVTEGRHGGRLRNLLVGIEVGLSVVALAVSGLLLNSYVRLTHVDKGFQTDRTTTVTLSLSGVRYNSEAKRVEFLHSLLDRVQQIPEVTAAGVAAMLPVSGEGMNNRALPQGAQTRSAEWPIVDFRSVSPGYLRALAIPLFAGRVFEERDRGRQVALLSMSAARRLWPEGDAVGKRFHLGDEESPALEVIGLVGDVHGVSLQAPPNPTVYLPYWARQRRPQISLVARTSGDPRSIAAAIRHEIRAIDPELPVPQFVGLQEVVDNSVSQRRFQLQLILMFGAASLLLSAMGVYAVVAFSVSQRTTEVGLRMVLGARPSAVRWMVWRQGMLPVAAGTIGGLLASLGVSRLVASLLFGVSAADPVTLMAVSAVLGLVTAAACYVPALRATRIDPAVAMRYE